MGYERPRGHFLSRGVLPPAKGRKAPGSASIRSSTGPMLLSKRKRPGAPGTWRSSSRRVRSGIPIRLRPFSLFCKKMSIPYHFMKIPARSLYAGLGARFGRRAPDRPATDFPPPPLQPISLRIEDGRPAEPWDVLQDEVGRAGSKSGRPMFGGCVPGLDGLRGLRRGCNGRGDLDDEQPSGRPVRGAPAGPDEAPFRDAPRRAAASGRRGDAGRLSPDRRRARRRVRGRAPFRNAARRRRRLAGRPPRRQRHAQRPAGAQDDRTTR